MVMAWRHDPSCEQCDGVSYGNGRIGIKENVFLCTNFPFFLHCMPDITAMRTRGTLFCFFLSTQGRSNLVAHTHTHLGDISSHSRPSREWLDMSPRFVFAAVSEAVQ